MNNDNRNSKKFEVAGSIIGAALGALIADDNQEGVTIRLLQAQLFCNFKQMINQVNTYSFFMEDNSLYKIDADGSKHFVKRIESLKLKLDKRFILKIK
jgi:hypothetical protein